jgi:uncharacterized lipoprotein YmbA
MTVPDTAEKKRQTSRFTHGALAAALLTLLLSGCIGGRSPAADFYLLTARAAPAQAAPATAVSIGVGPVRVAPFLARPPIATHGGGGKLQFADMQRWGEPLDQGIQRVTLQNLALLTGAQPRNFPWRQSAAPDYAVRLDIFDLDREADGSAVLEAVWQLEDMHARKLLHAQRERFTITVAGSGYDALTDAYSELLAQLAQRIAAAMPGAPATP